MIKYSPWPDLAVTLVFAWRLDENEDEVGVIQHWEAGVPIPATGDVVVINVNYAAVRHPNEPTRWVEGEFRITGRDFTYERFRDEYEVGHNRVWVTLWCVPLDTDTRRHMADYERAWAEEE